MSEGPSPARRRVRAGTGESLAGRRLAGSASATGQPSGDAEELALASLWLLPTLAGWCTAAPASHLALLAANAFSCESAQQGCETGSGEGRPWSEPTWGRPAEWPCHARPGTVSRVPAFGCSFISHDTADSWPHEAGELRWWCRTGHRTEVVATASCRLSSQGSFCVGHRLSLHTDPDARSISTSLHSHRAWYRPRNRHAIRD